MNAFNRAIVITIAKSSLLPAITSNKAAEEKFTSQGTTDARSTVATEEEMIRADNIVETHLETTMIASNRA